MGSEVKVVDSEVDDSIFKRVSAKILLESQFGDPESTEIDPPGITSTGLDLLSCSAKRYLLELIASVHSFGELALRSQPNVNDVNQGFSSLGISLPELSVYYFKTLKYQSPNLEIKGEEQENKTEFSTARKYEDSISLFLDNSSIPQKNSNPSSFSTIEKSSESNESSFNPSVDNLKKSEKVRYPWIPPFLPPFPQPHSYISTFTDGTDLFTSNSFIGRDESKVAKLRANQKYLAETSLENLYSKTIFGPSSSLKTTKFHTINQEIPNNMDSEQNPSKDNLTDQGLPKEIGADLAFSENDIVEDQTDQASIELTHILPFLYQIVLSSYLGGIKT
ncbi:hypothetical protein AYI68_g2677 [Smittium mucronatum]|uniref:Bromodomain associated domain-containing protein n=1 Tax=Smittium mucronatum TaxID=133383 RepID=A0A1R0H225_9FUNG|nr:hypothetical protein AYI68_g2677 [Smittium mucronatum]